MTRTLLAAAALSVAGYAAAQETLEPVIVDHVDGYWIAENCTPPSAAPECAGFHEMIRQHFTDREIGMLFGAATAYPEYRTSYNQVRERYDNLVRYVEDNGVIPVASVSVGTIDAIPPAPVVYEQTTTTYSEPIRKDVVINDADGVIVRDDPDAVLLNAESTEDLYPNAPATTTTTTTRQVVYYDDDMPRRER
jgi:hypothetical protein